MKKQDLCQGDHIGAGIVVAVMRPPKCGRSHNAAFNVRPY